jgi:hypothetical protein
VETTIFASSPLRPSSESSAPTAQANAAKIAPVPIQPALRPGSQRQPNEITSIPASGKHRTSQPHVVGDI